MARIEDLPVPWTLSRKRIVECARSYIGVPYLHQGRSRRSGVDCSGLIALMCNDLGVPFEDKKGGYSSQPHADLLIQPCEKCAWKPEDQRTLIPGDIVVFWGPNPKTPQHFGVLGMSAHGPTVIHSFSKYGKVLEHGWNIFWHKHFYARYLFPGTEAEYRP